MTRHPRFPDQLARSDRRMFLAAGLAALGLPRIAQAQLAGRPMLKITAPDGTVTELDEEGFARLPWHEVTTHTRWTDGPQQFRGPLLRDVLELAGAGEGVLQGRELRMTAMNEFQVDIPASDAWDFRPILAREMNGRTMRIRDKGPIWLIYPRDDIAALQNPVIDERWIWQLVDITVI